MTVLNYDYLQRIAVIMASILKLDVTIVNHELVRVAGTGKYQQKIGCRLPEGSSFAYALRTGQEAIVCEAGQGICHACQWRQECVETAHVCSPIIIEGRPAGVIGLIAFDGLQKQQLLARVEDYKDFIGQMSALIASKMAEDSRIEQLKIAQSQIETIFQTVTAGMLLLDKEGRVVTGNQAAASILGLKQEGLTGKEITQIFNGTSFDLTRRWRREVARINKRATIRCLASLEPVITNGSYAGAVLTFTSLQDVHRLVGEVTGGHAGHGFENIIGASPALAKCKEKAATAAAGNSTVLITGETGTGKELLARAIHAASSRREKPFIAINCGAIPETLLESELFGYEEGAFTGAKRGGKPGKFQLADGGTLFLDEIGDMPLFLQVKLLRVIQEGAIERLGGLEKIPVDVRIIAATNQDLPRKVQRGEFRADLYYRLNVIPIEIPPLRRRKEDIPALLAHFLPLYCRRLQKPLPRLVPEVEKAFLAYDWPGNVRELENAVEYAVNMFSGTVITCAHLPLWLQENLSTQGNNRLTPLRELERRELQKALAVYGTSKEGKEQIARALGIGLATVYRKLKKYGLEQ
ncbi:Anaerobic nitric oxide reductase transcription regulator NorR [Neomoorella glycerini]|uniref:Anaerobic nitric oxide reductase transcription regulator NorR n=1 Tax=Neomoorella glycerini TaxID=55779 RepID=A0A6I5ZW52_9FIRM|nr:sigma 54-interacting transcriptional regulator [Moorella glycerini]QGP93909.1 Anaerobic nitric oxide reductase transcription regulator NorR [Moorella glycerini]